MPPSHPHNGNHAGNECAQRKKSSDGDSPLQNLQPGGGVLLHLPRCRDMLGELSLQQ